MQTLNRKGLRENIVSQMKSILERAEAENRGLSDADDATFQALQDTFESAFGQRPPMGRQFFTWINTPQSGAITMRDVLSDQQTGPGALPKMKTEQKFSSYLVDEKGKQYPILAKGDSFLAAVEASSDGPLDGGRFDEMIDDGLTCGGFIRSVVHGPRTDYERAALQESSGEGGGYLVPTFFAAQIIDLFRARNQAMNAGAQTFEMQSEHHRFARVTSHPTSSWVSEVGDVGETDMTFGAREWQAKNLRTLIKVSRNLMQDSPNIDSLIQRELAASIAAEVDRVALFGGGVLEPIGLANEEGVLEEAVGGGLTGYDDVLDAYKRLLDANAPDPTALITSNREWAYFAKKKDGQGLPYPKPPALESIPFLPTSKLPTDGGVGSNESSMFLGHFPDLAIGFRAQLRIELLRELFAQTHQFGFLAHLRLDVGTFHPDSFCKLTGIITT